MCIDLNSCKLPNHCKQQKSTKWAIKDQLGPRVLWHRLTRRIQAHILVCFLTYALQKTLEGWCCRAGLGRSPRKVLDELAQIHSTDVTFPMTDGRTVRLRCIVRPEAPQCALLERLSLDLPQPATPSGPPCEAR